MHQGNWEYTATKYGLRGFMKTARRNSWEQGIRINYVAPCWIRSAIRTQEYENWLIEHGVEFGEQADCAGAMMRIACDKSINGKLVCSFVFCTLNLDKAHANTIFHIIRALSHDYSAINRQRGIYGCRQGRLFRPQRRVLQQKASVTVGHHRRQMA